MVVPPRELGERERDRGWNIGRFSGNGGDVRTRRAKETLTRHRTRDPDKGKEREENGSKEKKERGKVKRERGTLRIP